ncbi:hypothetical protein O9992_21295 [Vibrio lentus]|nr:hypothetical protein [Vibrio lentus]
MTAAVMAFSFGITNSVARRWSSCCSTGRNELPIAGTSVHGIRCGRDCGYLHRAKNLRKAKLTTGSGKPFQLYGLSPSSSFF